jgi:hypothetical protein
VETMPKMYYRGADGALLAYDITDHTSFQRVKLWVDQILQASNDYGSEPPPMILGTLSFRSRLLAASLRIYARTHARTRSVSLASRIYSTRLTLRVRACVRACDLKRRSRHQVRPGEAQGGGGCGRPGTRSRAWRPMDGDEQPHRKRRCVPLLQTLARASLVRLTDARDDRDHPRIQSRTRAVNEAFEWLAASVIMGELHHTASYVHNGGCHVPDRELLCRIYNNKSATSTSPQASCVLQ